MSAPLQFQGTDEERRANRLTHNFQSFDMDEPEECMFCCARSYHVAADYPCGEEPPRVENPNAAEEQLLRFQIYALAHGFNDGEREDH